MSDLQVLIVEDDALTASVYEEYLRRLPGFAHQLTLGSAAQAKRYLASFAGAAAAEGAAEAGARGQRQPAPREPDVLLLDMNLPDGHGLEVLRTLRAAGYQGGAVALTAAAEREVIRGAMALGVTHYLLKPFSFEEFSAQLTGYRELHATLGRSGSVAGQDGVDAIFSAGAPQELTLPKGLTLPTLALVRDALAAHPGAASASEVGGVVGLSRVTARRYLEHLAATGQAQRGARHGTPGRPEVEYLPVMPTGQPGID